jgi:hypothetical protein
VGASSSKTGDADGYVFKALLEAGRFIAAHLILAKIADRADARVTLGDGGRQPCLARKIHQV